ncbi:hypothetical protein NDU88_008728 [Pleurodeles waltl]|uniref:Uncharacterized protein n=1 Tax=Pleurodeles waltl TaxID=8319 RepID=A0AAV7RYW4_PLEWA|nr:hypothetical protein NDU88_008728 [Pleurodeles waltl]
MDSARTSRGLREGAGTAFSHCRVVLCSFMLNIVCQGDRTAKRKKTTRGPTKTAWKKYRGDRSLERCDPPIRTGKHCEGTALQSDVTLQCTRRALLYSSSLSPLGRNPTGGLTSPGSAKRSLDRGSNARGPLLIATRPSSAQGGQPRPRKNSRGDRSRERRDPPVRTRKHCEGTALQSDSTLQCTGRALLCISSLSPLGLYPTEGLTSEKVLKESTESPRAPDACALRDGNRKRYGHTQEGDSPAPGPAPYLFLASEGNARRQQTLRHPGSQEQEGKRERPEARRQLYQPLVSRAAQRA